MNIEIALPNIQTKPLNKNEKRWTLQREIFFILQQEDMRRFNLPRYKQFLQLNKLRHSPQSIKLWEKSKDKTVKKVKPLTSKAFGIFTAHLDEEALWYVKSVVQDKLNRGESPTCYIYSLNKSAVQ